MAYYSVKLFNRALQALNQSPVDAIDDLDEAPNRVIKLVRVHDDAVALALKGIGRGEFIGRASLSPIEAAGDFLFPYRFLLPEDALDFIDPPKGLGIERAIEKVGAVEQKVLRASSNADLELTYIRRVNVDLLGVEAFTAVALTLAAQVAYEMTNSRDHADRIDSKAKEAIRLARGSVGTSSENRPQRASRMGTVRGGARR